jgi:hypothetical protein
LLEAFSDLIADQQIMGRLLLLSELQISQRGADQDRSPAEQLADRLALIVFDIGPRFRISNRQSQPIHLSLRQPPPEPPGRAKHGYCQSHRHR